MANTEYEFLADAIIGLMRKHILLNGGNAEMLYDKFHSQLCSTRDSEYLRWVYDFFRELFSGAKEDRDYARDVVNVGALNDPQTMRLLKAHRKDITAGAMNMAALLGLAEILVDNDVTKVNQDGGIPTLSAHMKAKIQYDAQLYIQFDRGTMQGNLLYYASDSIYCAAVERHADNIEKLLAYREITGVVPNRERKDSFNEEEFLEYLAHGAVTDGWL